MGYPYPSSSTSPSGRVRNVPPRSGAADDAALVAGGVTPSSYGAFPPPRAAAAASTAASAAAANPGLSPFIPESEPCVVIKPRVMCTGYSMIKQSRVYEPREPRQVRPRKGLSTRHSLPTRRLCNT